MRSRRPWTDGTPLGWNSGPVVRSWLFRGLVPRHPREEFGHATDAAQAGENEPCSHEERNDDKSGVDREGEKSSQKNQATGGGSHLPVKGHDLSRAAFDRKVCRNPCLGATLDHDRLGETGRVQLLGCLGRPSSRLAKNIDSLVF